MANRSMSGHEFAGFQLNSSLQSHLYGWALLILTAIFCAVNLPHRVFVPGDPVFLFVVGGISIWRYLWGLMHWMRAMYYQHVMFPDIRARANRHHEKPTHLYLVITSYRIDTETNAAVYWALMHEVRRYNVPTTIIACVSDPSDAVLINDLVQRSRPPEGTTVTVLAQDGTGKRTALGSAMRHIAASNPLPGSMTVLMDGDTLLTDGCLEKSCSVLMSHPGVGAVTTENKPLVRGSSLIVEWYRLRMAQRHNLMCSVSVSGRVLVLTGRFLVYRAEIVSSPDFILTIENDMLRHWRLGKINFLTGDDKSAWFATLKQGWKMLYLPDVVIRPLEELPKGSFFNASTRLMGRWFGNMFRGGNRALALGPRKCGLFVWLCLIDQRISMWATLTAPVFFGLAGIFHDTRFFLIYVLWVVLSRSFQSVGLWITTGRFHPYYPFLIYYTQLMAAIIKVFMLFHLDLQAWTRQKSATRKTRGAVQRSVDNPVSMAMYVLSVGLLVVTVAWMSGVATDPTHFMLSSAAEGW